MVVVAVESGVGKKNRPCVRHGARHRNLLNQVTVELSALSCCHSLAR